MPRGNSRNWLVGSLFILAFMALSTPTWSADEVLGGGMPMPPQAAPTMAPGTPFGVQDGATPQVAPAQLQPTNPPEAGKPTLEPIVSPTNPPTATPTTTEQDCAALSEMPLCSPPGRFWLRSDALMWWTNGIHLPPLVTTNTSPNFPIIGVAGTQVDFGNDTYLNDGRAGVRMTLGGWLDRCHRWGIEADWFSIAGHSVDYSLNGIGTQTYVGRPFYDLAPTQSGAPTGNTWEVVAEQRGLINIMGTVDVHANDAFDSAGFLVRYNLCCCGGCGCNSCGETGCGETCNLAKCCDLNMNYCRTDFLVGYRHYSLSDGVTIHESLNDNTPGFGYHWDISDNFSCRNDFNGAELGLNTELRRGRASLNLLAKMAFGMNHQKTDINGSTVKSAIDGSAPPEFFSEGIYAGGPFTNGGIHEKDTFVVIPQLGVELGYQLTCHTRAFLGYNIIYWGNVMRAGEQISEDIDSRNFASSTQGANALPFPRFPDRSSTFWAQGINLGAEVRF